MATLDFADMESWNVAETQDRKVADTFFLGMESCQHFF